MNAIVNGVRPSQTFVMFDSVNPMVIPANHWVAGYLNGRYAWPDSSWDRFPGHVKISVLGGQPRVARFARVLDVESGDATDSDVVPFVRERLATRRTDATIYCNRDTLPAVRAALADAGLEAGKDCRLWVATLDGTKTIQDMSGVWAIQDQGGVLAPYDISTGYGPADFVHPARP